MANTISTAFVNQYKANIEILNQQLGSKLMEAVRIEPQVGEYAYYDQIGRIDTLTTSEARHADTTIIDTPHSRRRVGLAAYRWAELIDTPDKVQMLADPTSPYAQNASYKFGRDKDSLIITAADGTAYTGKTGSVSTTFSGTQSIPSDATASGTNYLLAGDTTVLNIDKIRGAGYLLDLADVPAEGRYLVGHPKGKYDLLGTTEVTSIDYNGVKALVDGQVDSFLGFKFIWTTLVAYSGTEYKNFAWHKNAMLFAVGKDDLGFKARIEERADKNYSTQVFNEMMIGCTRMDEKAIVRIYST